jgi:tetratricopeptide (TPR) repeat protein
MTDHAPSPLASDPAGTSSTLLLDQILTKAHPLLAEAINLAAVPHSYDADLLKALRARDDGRDEKLTARLAEFSFIWPAGDSLPGERRFAMQAAERELLQLRWVATDPRAFIAAHQRALAHFDAHPDPDPFVQDQLRLYHMLLADRKAGIEYLASTFRAYAGERRLAAADRLIDTALEARGYLVALRSRALPRLDDLLAYMLGRLAQLRGQWEASLPRLKSLHEKDDLSPLLKPYVTRAYGLALAKAGDYVEAIKLYQAALTLFRKLPGAESEQAYTMFSLGDAHVNLAVAARGYREFIQPRRNWRRQFLINLILFPALLPLVVFLSLYFGPRVWNPKFWPVVRGQDWTIARLFGSGARWYRRAKRLLMTSGRTAELVQADEKRSYLYLTMGDAAYAAPICERLLAEQEAPLGEYRRGRIEANLGQALLRLGQPQAALIHLETALPVLKAYADAELEARVQGLLAEANLESGNNEQAFGQFDKAMRLYQAQDDIVGATEIAERLHELERAYGLDVKAKAVISTMTSRLARRQYLVRFQHPVLAFFQQAALALLAAFLFLIPLLATRVETRSQMTANINFEASPLLDADPDFNPALNQATTLTVQTSFQPEVAGQLILGSLLFYVAFYTLAGFVVLSQTPLSAIQKAAQSQAVRVDLQGIRVGQADREHFLRWYQVTQFVVADVLLFGVPLAQSSRMAVTAPEGHITLSGHTSWYTALRRRIDSILPASTARKDLSYDPLRSKMGALYLSGFLIVIAFLTIGELAPSILGVDLLWTPYSLADLYPYFHLATFLPPFWWGVVTPLRVHRLTEPQSRLAWWAGGAAVTLALLRLFGFLWPGTRLSQPDIYPALAAMILVAAPAAEILSGRSQLTTKRAYSLAARVAALFMTAGILIGFGSYLWREVVAYHYLVAGNSDRDQGAQTEAVAAYDRLLVISPGDVTGLINRAAAQAQLGQFEAAVASYSEAIAGAGVADRLYASRAIVYENWALSLRAGGQTGDAAEKFAAALADFDQAIALDPDQSNYYLWRGVAYHSLGQLETAFADYEQALALDPQNVQALAGRGWVYFTQANGLSAAGQEAEAGQIFELALASFEEAAQIEESGGIWLAVGYAHFRLGQYEQTLSDLERAVALEPDNPALLASRGTAHWRLANPVGVNRCASNTATEAEKAETVAELNLAIEDFNRALDIKPDDHFTYRTRAQVEYLLRTCPGFDVNTQLRKAVASYAEALRYSPDNLLYLQFRARLGYVLADSLFDEGQEAEARAVLDEAVADIEQAYALDPDYPENQRWYDWITDEAGRMYLSWGEQYYAAGDYAQALSDFVRVTEFRPESARAAFKAGLASLALGDVDGAANWYDEGLRRAPGLEENLRRDVLQDAIDELDALLNSRPELTEPGVLLLEWLQGAMP